MGVTDNAFIRIFDDGHSTERLARSGNPETTHQPRGPHIAIAPSAVSQVYAGMTDSPPATVPLSPTTSADEDPKSIADGSIFVLPNAPQRLDEEASGGHSQRIRLDEGSPDLLRGHHIKSSAFHLAAAASVDAQPERTGVSRVSIAPETVSSSATRETTDQVARVLAAADQLGVEADVSTDSPSAVKSVEWLPDWEVDQFRWPSVCQRLAEHAATPLSRIVRPLLTGAWKGQNVVAVTSFAKGEGATTVALSIARMAASYNVSVALVEGDLDDPTIGSSLGIAFDDDWTNGSEAARLNAAAIGSLHDKLVVLPLKRPGANVVELPRSADARAKMIFELSDAFELVIVDAGPIFTAAYRWFCDMVGDTIDRALLVRDVRHTTVAQLDDACARLSDAGLPAVAVVENFYAETGQRKDI